MEERKYILTDETKEFNGRTLYRIKAAKDFGHVKKGDLGGWVESENNLSQKNDCWIFEDAKVYGKAKVRDKSIVHDNAKVFGNAALNDMVDVYGDARIYGKTWLYGDVIIRDDAEVFGFADVFGLAYICGNAKIKSNKDYAVYKNTWSSGCYFTWTRSNNMWKVGCFYGNGEELITKAYEKSEKTGKCYAAIVNVNRLISNID